MVDTVRTEVELLSIFADAQPAGSITAQDMRDLIVSVKTLTPPAYCTLSVPTTLNASLANNNELVAWTTQDAIAGITHSVSVDPSEITFDYSGTYAINVTGHMMYMGGTTGQIQVWLEHHDGTLWELMDDAALWADRSDNNIFPFAFTTTHPFTAGHKLRVRWRVDTTQLHLHGEAATANFPVAPAIRLSVTPLTLT